MGVTHICELGPVVSEAYCTKAFNFTFNRFNFTEAKVTQAIQKFLNNIRYNITQAVEITKEELMQDCGDIYMFSFMEDSANDN